MLQAGPADSRMPIPAHGDTRNCGAASAISHFRPKRLVPRSCRAAAPGDAVTVRLP